MKQKKTNHYLLGTVFCLLLLLLLTPGQATKVQAATDNSLIDVKLAEGIRRYDYAYEVLNLVNQETCEIKPAARNYGQKSSGMRHDKSPGN